MERIGRSSLKIRRIVGETALLAAMVLTASWLLRG